MGFQDLIGIPPARRLLELLTAKVRGPGRGYPSIIWSQTGRVGPRGEEGNGPGGWKTPHRMPMGPSPPISQLFPEELELFRLLEELANDPRHDPGMLRDGSSFGRFTIKGEIDRGESAIVYLATDPDPGRPVALKVPHFELVNDEEHRRRFEFEGEIASILDHPNIVPIYEVGEVAGLPYIAMEYIEGVTLADWLLAASPTTPGDASLLVREIAGAVEHAHNRGIMNLDLKPRNIMLRPAVPEYPDRPGVIPLIIDFGLARAIGENDEGPGGRALAGTPTYMAPEQILEGPAGCGPTADIYSLGVILYELLVGRPPHQGENRFQTIRAVIVDEPIGPKTLRPIIPAELGSICMKCLSKSPDSRFSSVRELIECLEHF